MKKVINCALAGIFALTAATSAANAASISILEDNGAAGLSVAFDLDAAGPNSINTSVGWFLGLSGAATTFRLSNRSGAASTIQFNAGVDHADISTANVATGNIEPAPVSFFFDAATQAGGFSFGNATAPVNPNAVSAVPLPASSLLLLGGLAGLIGMRKRKAA